MTKQMSEGLRPFVSTARLALQTGWMALARRRGGIDAAAMLGGVAVALLRLDGFDAVFASLWWVACVVVIRSDLESFVIPDEATLAIAVIGLLDAGARAWLEARRLHGPIVETLTSAVGSSLLQGLIGFALFWLVARIYALSAGREGLGFGDVKLSGACALWLGLADQAAALEIAALAAIALVLWSRGGKIGRQTAVPFGAFLAPAAWLVFVLGPSVRDVMETWP